jgi:predicted restriction endonuclease
VPWRSDKRNRLNPRNGLCLSAIHDKAFDSYLFTLSNDWRVLLSRKIKDTKDKFLQEVFWTIEEKQMELPEKFGPDRIFVEKHRQKTYEIESQRKEHS